MNTTYEQRNYKALLTTPFALGGAGMVTAGMLFAMYLLIQVDGPEATSEPIVTIPDIFQDDIPPIEDQPRTCLLYTSPSPRDQRGSRMPSSA